MKKKTNKKAEFTEKERKIGKLMISTWSSLESHILWTYKELGNANNREDAKFHIECVKEYVEMLKLLSELY